MSPFTQKLSIKSTIPSSSRSSSSSSFFSPLHFLFPILTLILFVSQWIHDSDVPIMGMGMGGALSAKNVTNDESLSVGIRTYESNGSTSNSNSNSDEISKIVPNLPFGDINVVILTDVHSWVRFGVQPPQTNKTEDGVFSLSLLLFYHVLFLLCNHRFSFSIPFVFFHFFLSNSQTLSPAVAGVTPPS